MEKTAKQKKTIRFSFRMTEEEAKRFEAAAQLLDRKPSYVARLALSAVSQAAFEKEAQAA